MGQHLDYDAGIKKKLGISDDIEQDHVFKLAHVRSQLEEIKKFLWRERVELILAEGQADDTNPLIADKGRSQVTEKNNNIAQVTRSLKILNELAAELAE